MQKDPKIKVELSAVYIRVEFPEEKCYRIARGHKSGATAVSMWRTSDYCLTQDTFESERIHLVLSRIEDLGGLWEQEFGVILFVWF